MSIKLVMPSNHLIHCRPLLLLPSIFPSIIHLFKSVIRHPTPLLLPGKSHGWRNLVGCSPRSCLALSSELWFPGTRGFIQISQSHVYIGTKCRPELSIPQKPPTTFGCSLRFPVQRLCGRVWCSVFLLWALTA